MRSHILGIALVALLVPHAGRAQVYLVPTSAPAATAAEAGWQLSGDALYYQGEFYYPTGPTEFFDGRVMVRTGTHEGVPLYENSTQLPYEVVYVPVGRNLMRPYERRRVGPWAGTSGSRTPSFPVEPASSIRREEGRAPMIARATTQRAAWDWPKPIQEQAPPALASAPGRRPTTVPTAVIRSVPSRETMNAGAYLEFDGERHFSAGRAVQADPIRFVRVGGINSASVFRDPKGDPKTIYVESVPGGLLAPYARR